MSPIKSAISFLILFSFLAPIALGQDDPTIPGDFFIKPDRAVLISGSGDRLETHKGDRILVLGRAGEGLLRGVWTDLEVTVAVGDVLPAEQAREHFDKLVHEDPTSINFVARGFVKLFQKAPGHAKSALEDFEKAVELDPDNATAYLGRAEAHLFLGNHTEQMADYAHAMQTNPHLLAPYVRRSRFLNPNEDDAQLYQLVDDLTQAIRLAPKWAELYTRRADARTWLAQVLQEEAALDRGMAKDLQDGTTSSTPPREVPRISDGRQSQTKPTEGRITVLYPNGGEVLKRDQEFEIRWETEGAIDRVRIMAHGGSDQNAGGWYTIAESAPNTGKYTASIPRNWGYPLFKIHVTSLDRAVQDASDDHFTARLGDP
jgi:hypothetical protein